MWVHYVSNLTTDQGSLPSAGSTLQEITLPSPWEACRTLKGLQVSSVSDSVCENKQGFSTCKPTGTLTILQKHLWKLSHNQKKIFIILFHLSLHEKVASTQLPASRCKVQRPGKVEANLEDSSPFCCSSTPETTGALPQ